LRNILWFLMDCGFSRVKHKKPIIPPPGMFNPNISGG